MNYEDDKLYDWVFKTNVAFYEKIYKDEWLINIFKIIDQKIITTQQTDFMVAALGGPKRYCGRNPVEAHQHIFIDEEMWKLRETYLIQAFSEVGLPDDLKKRWLMIDEAFKNSLIKKDKSECVKRYFTDQILYFPKKAS